MIDTPVWLGPLINGAVMSGVLLVVFQVQERYKSRKERVRYATLIVVELNQIHKIIRPESWARFMVRTDHLVGDIPKSVYDGLVSSSMISIFDADLQRQLHTFYKSVAARRSDQLRSTVSNLLDDVHRFKRRNKQLRYFFDSAKGL